MIPELPYHRQQPPNNNNLRVHRVILLTYASFTPLTIMTSLWGLIIIPGQLVMQDSESEAGEATCPFRMLWTAVSLGEGTF